MLLPYAASLFLLLLSLEHDAVPLDVQGRAWEDVSFGKAHKGWRAKQCRAIERLVGTVNGPCRISSVAVRPVLIANTHARMHGRLSY